MESMMVIAIDGPAASGKGTLAKRLALHYGLPYLDTGLLYRSVALALLDLGQDLSDSASAAVAALNLRAESLSDPRLRGSAIGEAASIVSAQGAVRAALLDWQRRFAGAPAGAVLDGRDIGTVVCPDAALKLFVTASAEERARRRHRELCGRGEPVAYEAVLADILRRDARDANRDAAPLRVAEGAVVIDTTTLDADAAFRAATIVVDGLAS